MKKISSKKTKIKPTKYAPKSDISPKQGNKFTARYKKMIREKGIWKFILYICLIGLIVIASAALIFALYIIISAPDFDKNDLYQKEVTTLYFKDKTELAKIGTENRTLVTYDELPQVLIDAVIATEDSRFFQHNGLDIARFLKASAGQILHSSTAGGASTISMQIIKNTYTNKEAHGIRGIIRKFTDIYMSVFKLENCYTKEEIMEFYLNSQWFTHDGNVNYGGIYGVEEAAQTYFGKSVSDISLAEASLMAGMFQNPYLYNPNRNPVGCRNRQKTVLKLMVLHGYITEEEKDAVLAIPVESLLVADDDTKSSTNTYQDIIDLVIKYVEDETGQNPYNTPMKIYTTIDPKIQNVLDNMEEEVYWKFYDDKDQESTVVTSVTDGSITALSGGRNYAAKGLNRVTVKRQPGSTAKPFFDYGPYIEFLNGSTGSYFFDDPYTYSNGATIMDADKGYQGMINIRKALVGSRNITALQAFQAVMKEDPSLIPNYVHSFGLDYGSNLYESASIGGFDGVTPIQMSAAYGVYARGGYYIEPYIFTKIVYEDGKTYEHKYTKEKVCSEETAYMITSSLISVTENNGLGNVNVSGTQIAGKTGTTTMDNTAIEKLKVPKGTIPDIWSVGYDPEYVVALWYGYDTITSEYNMQTIQGWTARTKLMPALVNRIFSPNQTFKRPSGVISVEIEKETLPLQLPSENTPADMRITELFREGTEPTEVSPKYQTLSSPTNGNATVKNGNVTLTWTGIATPDSINTSILSNHYDEYYGIFASSYYEKRIAYNAANIGTLTYDIYILDETGNQKYLDTTNKTTYTTPITGDTTFYIRSAYTIFKAAQSPALKINVKYSGKPIVPEEPSEEPIIDPSEEPEETPGLD